MKKYFRRPTRIDCYPKTEENLEEMKEVKVYSHSSPIFDCTSTVDTEVTINKLSEDASVIKCSEYKIGNIEIIENKVFNEIDGIKDVEER